MKFASAAATALSLACMGTTSAFTLPSPSAAVAQSRPAGPLFAIQNPPETEEATADMAKTNGPSNNISNPVNPYATTPMISLTIQAIFKMIFSGQIGVPLLLLIVLSPIVSIVLPLLNLLGNNTISLVYNIIRTSLQEVVGAPMQYATYPKHLEYPNVPLDDIMRKIDGVPPLNYWFKFSKILGVVGAVTDTAAGLEASGVKDTDPSTYDNYNKLFTDNGTAPNSKYPTPPYVPDHWEEDAEFARQFLNGVNPVMVEVVSDVSGQLSNEIVSFFKTTKVAGESVDLGALAKANRLLYVDYEGLDALNKHPHQAYPQAYNNKNFTDDETVLSRVGKEPRYFESPIIVLQLDEKREKLQVLGVQLERTPGAQIYTSENTEANKWLFIKTAVAAADSQYHEWVTHLGKTHYTMEPHIVAIHNTLRKTNHKIYPFLAPMCRDTLLLNWAARLTLAEFGPDSFGDKMTSVGVGQYMQLIKKYWEDYDFFKSGAADEELEGRGFSPDVEFPGYRYRTDSLKLWDIYGTFATDYVNEVYASDAEVAADADLQSWATETSDPTRGAVKGFPTKFTDKKILVKTLQTLFWICSGFHAAVNFSQYDFYAYQANKPLGFRAPVSDWPDATGDKDWIFENGMPHMAEAKQGIATARVLTYQSHQTIDRLDEFFGETGSQAYNTFKENLQVMSDEIDARSANDLAANGPVYEYLKPCNVPSSIDI